MLRLFALCVGAVSLLVASCGGSAGTSCGAVAPCGGDVVGSWSIVSSCLSPTGMFASEKQAFFAQFCAAGSHDGGGATDAGGTSSVQNDVASATWTGSWSFGGTMSYSVSILATVHESFTCNDGETCSALDSEIKAAQANYPTLQSAGCTGSGGSCSCTVEWSSLNNESGTYGSSGTALSLAPSGGLPTAQIGYCVQGTTMHWIPTDSVAGGPPYPDLVAKRQ